MVVYIDDVAGISPDEVLFRRIAPDQLKFDAAGNPSLSTGAFHTEEMSVHIASRTTPENVLRGYPRHSLAAFTAQDARDAGCIIVPDPDDNSHYFVCRKDDPTKSLTGSQAKKITNKARIVYMPPSEQTPAVS
jgi:hypothetical protein